MVPPVSHPVWRQLVTGERVHQFEAVSASMCTARIIRFVRREGGSPAAVELGIRDLHAFFTKCEAVLASDIRRLFGEDGHVDER